MEMLIIDYYRMPARVNIVAILRIMACWCLVSIINEAADLTANEEVSSSML